MKVGRAGGWARPTDRRRGAGPARHNPRAHRARTRAAKAGAAPPLHHAAPAPSTCAAASVSSSTLPLVRPTTATARVPFGLPPSSNQPRKRQPTDSNEANKHTPLNYPCRCNAAAYTHKQNTTTLAGATQQPTHTNRTKSRPRSPHLRRGIREQLDAALDQARHCLGERAVRRRQHAGGHEAGRDAADQLVLWQRAQVLAVHPRQLDPVKHSRGLGVCRGV